MEWKKMTAPELVKAVDATKGVCIIPLGSLEKHGDHLPIGTDNFLIHQKAVLASKIDAHACAHAYRFMTVFSIIPALLFTFRAKETLRNHK